MEKKSITLDRTRSVKQSNNLTIARYKLTLLENRILFALCSQIKKNDDSFDRIRMSVADLADFCGIEGKNKYAKIRTISNNLMRKIVTIPTVDGGEYTTHWLQARRYYPSDCTIEFRLDDDLRGELLQLRAAYVNVPASMLISFKRAYSARLYLILKRMMDSGSYDFEYNLDFFRDKFELGKTYEKFSNLKDGVLDPCLTELNEKSNISIEWEYIKVKRSFKKIHFLLAYKEQEPFTVPAQPKKISAGNFLTDDEQKILNRLMNPDRWNITEKMARQLIKDYPLSLLDANLRYAYKYRKNKTSLGGWLISCIRNDEAGREQARVAAKKAEEKRQHEKAAEAADLKHGIFADPDEAAKRVETTYEILDNAVKESNELGTYTILQVKKYLSDGMDEKAEKLLQMHQLTLSAFREKYLPEDKSK
ncbi:RepB family plasmid replication initiator protein [Mitsuokella sp.]|uniref:replication initiation protein n=1 Tax=Mitsuokella sp. TaxID=2049034 RepID=UPI003D7E6853